jgi:hypothetical protein
MFQNGLYIKRLTLIMDLRNQLSAQNHSKKGGSQNYGIISSF